MLEARVIMQLSQEKNSHFFWNVIVRHVFKNYTGCETGIIEHSFNFSLSDREFMGNLFLMKSKIIDYNLEIYHFNKQQTTGNLYFYPDN